MELEDVSTKVDQEARRVAAAFDVERWVKEEGRNNENPYWKCCGTSSSGQMIEWHFNHSCLLSDILIDDKSTFWWTGDHRYIKGSGVWVYWENGAYDGMMARALYCLGFEEEEVFADINYPLSSHEKLELRLSMPRDFWPEKWLDKEVK